MSIPVEMIDSLLENLVNAGWAIVIFLCAYLSNMAFGIYYNVHQLGEKFDRKKILNSLFKILSITFGLILLVIATTSLPTFANYIGWLIPDEYTEVLNSIAVLSVCLYVSCKYIFEAINKFSDILNNKKQ